MVFFPAFIPYQTPSERESVFWFGARIANRRDAFRRFGFLYRECTRMDTNARNVVYMPSVGQRGHVDELELVPTNAFPSSEGIEGWVVVSDGRGGTRPYLRRDHGRGGPRPYRGCGQHWFGEMF